MTADLDTVVRYQERTYPGKRTLDVVFSLAALVVAAPLLALSALVVKLLSPGPVLYRGLRAGLGGAPFYQLKLRTMVVQLEGGGFTSKDDPRIIPGGRALRFFKIDEIPQFVNILRGEMSIVGPRPEELSVVNSLYTAEQRRVLSVRPGLTCLLQVRIFPDFTYDVPEGANPEEYYQQQILPQRLGEDLDYVDQISFWTDLRIIFKTAWCLLGKSWLILLRRRSPA